MRGSESVWGGDSPKRATRGCVQAAPFQAREQGWGQPSGARGEERRSKTDGGGKTGIARSSQLLEEPHRAGLAPDARQRAVAGWVRGVRGCIVGELWVKAGGTLGGLPLQTAQLGARAACTCPPRAPRLLPPPTHSALSVSASTARRGKAPCVPHASGSGPPSELLFRRLRGRGGRGGGEGVRGGREGLSGFWDGRLQQRHRREGHAAATSQHKHPSQPHHGMMPALQPSPAPPPSPSQHAQLPHARLL